MKLKTYMYNDAGIDQCKFNVQSIFKKPTPEQPDQLLLEPATPNKKAKREDSAHGSSSQKNINMQDDSEDEETLLLDKKKN